MSSGAGSSNNNNLPSAIAVIAGTTLLAGTADILAALIQYYFATGKNPTGVLRFIASGLFGTRAFTGGNEMIIWGLFLHYIIVLIWTLIFFLAFPLLRRFTRNPWPIAVFITAVIWLVMNLVVLPLSKTPSVPLQLESALISTAILFFAVGTPLAFLLHRYHK